MFKPVPQEIRVVTTTATSTLGIRGEISFRPYMMTNAKRPMIKVGQ